MALCKQEHGHAMRRNALEYLGGGAADSVFWHRRYTGHPFIYRYNRATPDMVQQKSGSMTVPRSKLVDVNLTPWYHVISKTVRRAFLLSLGEDDRKQWLEAIAWAHGGADCCPHSRWAVFSSNGDSLRQAMQQPNGSGRSGRVKTKRRP